MHYYFYVLLVIMFYFTCCTPAYATKTEIDTDKMLKINGQRIFMLGLYENPSDDHLLDVIKQAGFVMVQSQPNREALDRLHRHGLYAWVNTGELINLSTETYDKTTVLQNLIQTLHDHPALLVWELPDEALWNVWYSCLTYAADEKNQLDTIVATIQDSNQREQIIQLITLAQEYMVSGKYTESENTRNQIRSMLKLEPIPEQFKLSSAKQRSNELGEGLKNGYQLLKQIDPNHVVWMNHAPRNSISQLAFFSKAADIIGCDIYPVPSKKTGHSDLADTSLSSIGAYTRRMQSTAPDKPVWMVLQGFGWADLDPDATPEKHKELRRPNLAETRFMAYDAIVHGARGILYWGTTFIEKNSTLWENILQLIKELSELQPILSAPDAEIPLKIEIEDTWGSVDRGIVILTKQFGQIPWFLIVNEWNDPLHYTLRGLERYEGVRFHDTKTKEQFQVNKGCLQLISGGNQVRVLSPE